MFPNIPPFFLLAIIGLSLSYLYRLVMDIITYRSANRPTPENVKDVYDEETYQRWKAYTREKCRLAIFSTLANFAILFLLLHFHVFALVANALFPQGGVMATLTVLAVYLLAQVLGLMPLEYYDTMVIEEKYGFNRSNRKTFFLDQLKGFIISMILLGALTLIFQGLHQSMGDGVLILFAIAAFCVMTFVTFIFPYINRLFNHFTPLEDGELKDKLTALLEKNGYQVRAIQVMDASRRSTKSNAYFTGLGKTKTIVLYDTLVQKAEPDEICAIFAHEMGHGMHRDVLKGQLISLITIALMGVGLWLLARTETLYPFFYFETVNYGLTMVLLSETLMGILSPLMGLFTSWRSRRAEYRADKTAVQEGYGPALICALKNLSRDNFSNLSPSPLVVKLSYSHPPLSQRIAAIEKAMKE